MFVNRRSFLHGLGGLGLLGLTRPALAGTTNKTKFVFVMNYGGWDPTRVLAPEFDNPNVDMERDAEEASLGDLRFVDHADRPAVRTFFERYGASSLIMKGVLVPSVAHDNCLRIALTGPPPRTARTGARSSPAPAAPTSRSPRWWSVGPPSPGTTAPS